MHRDTEFDESLGSNLPNELWLEIFKHLPTKEKICILPCVCRRWFDLVQDESSIWEFQDLDLSFVQQKKDEYAMSLPSPRKMELSALDIQREMGKFFSQAIMSGRFGKLKSLILTKWHSNSWLLDLSISACSFSHNRCSFSSLRPPLESNKDIDRDSFSSSSSLSPLSSSSVNGDLRDLDRNSLLSSSSSTSSFYGYNSCELESLNLSYCFGLTEAAIEVLHISPIASKRAGRDMPPPCAETLTFLNLSNQRLIPSESFKFISNFTNLKELNLSRCSRLCYNIGNFTENLIHLERLILQDLPLLFSSFLKYHLASPTWGPRKTLKELDLSGCFNIKSPSCVIDLIRNCPSLQKLDLSNTEVPHQTFHNLLSFSHSRNPEQVDTAKNQNNIAITIGRSENLNSGIIRFCLNGSIDEDCLLRNTGVNTVVLPRAIIEVGMRVSYEVIDDDWETDEEAMIFDLLS